MPAENHIPIEIPNIPPVKMIAGNYAIPVTRWIKDGRWFFKFPYSRLLLEEIKSLLGRKWHPDEKIWSAPVNARNNTAIQYLTYGEEDPFDRFYEDIVEHEFERPLWPHQKNLADFALTRHYCIMAAEQGTGKTLALIETMEQSQMSDSDVWYVAPLSALEAVRLEFKKWKCKVKPTLMTYERMTRVIKNWDESTPIPKMLIFDESSRLKNPASQRALAAQCIADAVREVHKSSGFVILATGTPAPRTPGDWWMQCEIAYPGYIREGSLKLFVRRLAKYEYVETDAGSWPELIGWWDNEDKCANCCQLKEVHDINRPDCTFKPSVNELKELHERLQGLVYVLRKKDCQEYLPDKHYRIVRCIPSKELVEQAKKLTELSESAIETLSGCRALSDGFQYYKEEVGKKPCPRCNASGIAEEFIKAENEDEADYVDEDDEDSFDELPEDYDFVKKEATCSKCGGTGEIIKYRRNYIKTDSPKLKKLEGLLEEFEDTGRVIIYAGFQASIDRIVELCLSKQWTVFRVDGRSWQGYSPSGDTFKKSELVELFQDKTGKIEKIAWVANPEASGMGLTLTASPVEIFFSNTFKGEDRQQAEDRGHRPGMDEEKGLTVIDLFCLQTDQLVYDNLMKKSSLQNVTLGVIQQMLDIEVESYEEIEINDDSIVDAYGGESYNESAR
jgi:hypothetical protein